MKSVRKDVLSVKTIGSRYLPVIKASPKVTLAVMEKPLIQDAVEEAIPFAVTTDFTICPDKQAIKHRYESHRYEGHPYYCYASQGQCRPSRATQRSWRSIQRVGEQP